MDKGGVTVLKKLFLVSIERQSESGGWNSNYKIVEASSPKEAQEKASKTFESLKERIPKITGIKPLKASPARSGVYDICWDGGGIIPGKLSEDAI